MGNIVPWSSLLKESFDGSTGISGAKAYVRRGRELLLERHRAGARGYELVLAYSDMMDCLLRHLFEDAGSDFFQRYPNLDRRCALVAQGGYGRRELNPHSDIDLLFLHVWKVTPYLESVAEKVLYALWDTGLQVGHAIRSMVETVRLSNKDPIVKTALVDARYLCGDREVFGEFQKGLQENFLRGNRDRFVRRKVEEFHSRHDRYGGSVYLLEPDIKEGEGGLRDIHAALWIAKAKLKVGELGDLIPSGLMSQKDLERLNYSLDFLLRVRNELHFAAGKHQDQLSFEEQERTAQALGFKDEEGLRGVEVFMRSYYLHAAEISRVTSLAIHRMAGASKFSRPGGQPAGREIREGVSVSKWDLRITQPSILASNPENLMTIFAEAQRHRVDIDHDTRELIREYLGFFDNRIHRFPKANDIFLQILGWKERIYETLLDMHRCDILDALLPEFGRLRCMVLHDLYHIYTVDQHSMRAVKEFERLKAGKYEDSLPLLTQLARETDKTEVLLLGILFHDIGKGYGGGHSEIGCNLVKKIARRLRLNVEDRVLLAFLVRQHLLLPHTAFRRDIDDEDQIIDFARAVGSVSNLKMLYLLTYSDTKAVGPEVWNNWKGSLLEDLYIRALRVLEGLKKGEFRREDSRLKIRRIKTRLKRRLSSLHAHGPISSFLDGMPDRYFLSTPEEEIPLHFGLLGQFLDQVFLSSVRHFPEREYSEMVICTKDRPGLFASIAGVFASAGLDILSARITTRSDGFILDVFRISHLGKPEVVMEPNRWSRLQGTLGRVLTGAEDVARLVSESGSPLLFKRRSPRVSTVVRVDNGISEYFTILEVYTQDRIGVLFKITYTLHQLGFPIHLAKISTNVDQVADVFSVTDDEGKKVQDEEKLEVLRQNLVRNLQTEDERVAQPVH